MPHMNQYKRAVGLKTLVGTEGRFHEQPPTQSERFKASSYGGEVTKEDL